MELTDFGLIGLGVMGSALSRNVESRGYKVSVYNRNYKKTEAFLKEYAHEQFVGAKDYKTFVRSIARPRKIMIMVKAGAPVDAVITDLVPHLQKGDIIIDGGNSHYTDTDRRVAALKEKGLLFLGCGVSGGEEGALRGPSLMPGGSKLAYKSMKKIFTAIAAADFSTGKCVSYIGDGGAGHYVKMVHNGIEYGVMQLLAEAYDMYTHIYKLKAPHIGEIFSQFQKGKLRSFLLQISIDVLLKKDEFTKKPLIDNILDKAAQKGTGKWTSTDTLSRGLPLPTITEAVFARYASGEKDRRVVLSTLYKKQQNAPLMPLEEFTDFMADALYAAIVSTYIQGYDLIARTSKEEKWNVNLSEVSRIWQGGCIIRAKLLQVFFDMYKGSSKKLVHPFAAPSIQRIMKKNTLALRQIAAFASEAGIPAAAFSTSLSYFDAMTRKRLPANFIQGLRDYFGAHTYERIDKKGSFHSDWTT
ncbi:MAG: NADP-dependent phosphogluconate dehydrogenase [Candidatus Magasanikbacteria bacterium]|jgi:6-phosphogluconate dehydrogenase|nr:NADP-dependent phosphogluconate dehydrogenase [Candidatus Magasanikbacteria bacterium]MBT4350220.1 NADP-dependent phosphogluconate dehydrogenase [Candidatus Magasanikbacteria bacterium]MBT4541816.1 NADP-dependent phosphogluconate dehydrogenase [Candidatus Magasanikbacteria bacterium]MBT6252845.1 NADP-dependent phosphogluconate dehydrogenase [Candidatus Magasanikbacteria bacterium]